MYSRALIVLLLVLNLGVAAWWLLRAEPAAPALPAHPAGVPRLQLLEEAGAAAHARPPASTAPDAAATPPEAAPVAAAPAPEETPATEFAPASRCFSFGPYADPALAGAAQAKLPAGVQAARLRGEPSRRGGHWDVLMPPQADPAAARALAQRIDAAGFKDYYVVAEGASANGIALGRFGSEEKARSHQAALQAAGFQAQIQAPADSTTWLDVEAGDAFDAAAARTTIDAARMRERSCAGRA